MKKTLPSLRVSEKTIEKVEHAIKKYNETSLFKLSQQEFRRVALELLSQAILLNHTDILKLINITD